MTERVTDRVNGGMRALGSVVGKALGQVPQAQAQANVANADSAKVAESLHGVARAIDRLAEAVRGLRDEPGKQPQG